MENLTLKKIEAAAREIEKNAPAFKTPGYCAGVPVFEMPAPPPKYRLSKEVRVSERFRQEFDTWLAGRFGYQESLLKENEVLFMRDYGVMIQPNHRALLAQICS